MVGEAPGETVSEALPEAPLREAPMALDPLLAAVASPAPLMVATDALELVHVASEVTSWVVPSE